MLKTTEAEFNKSNKHFVVASMKLAKLKEQLKELLEELETKEHKIVELNQEIEMINASKEKQVEEKSQEILRTSKQLDAENVRAKWELASIKD